VLTWRFKDLCYESNSVYVHRVARTLFNTVRLAALRAVPAGYQYCCTESCNSLERKLIQQHFVL
jgi:hypothetical protein